MTDLMHQETTETIIKCFYKVDNSLGFGFLEKVYEKAMMIELVNHHLNASNQFPIKVLYNNQIIGDYYADILVENCIVVELKAAETLIPEHEQQIINYLKATDLELGLLFNFGKKAEFRRIIFTNDRKKRLKNP
ncbi:MAG TPA: GxxExxY protein [Bacteroidales bacterium]|nr:GxxExxY protein [Bacteroidales bacterium]HRZ49305.1 GxxExxY protein [Bacteroidales bacterium]